MFEEFSGITYSVASETGLLIFEARSKAQREIEGDTLKAKLSGVAGTVHAIFGMEAIGKGMQTYGVAQRHFEGYVLKEPVAQEEIRPRVPTLQALNERIREHQLFQAVEKATYEEFARIDAREKWEAGKQTAVIPSPTTTPPAPPVVAIGASGGVVADKTGWVVKAPIQSNSTKTPRKDSIVPVIELAQTKCRDPKDINQVWPQMQVLADNEQAPFLASTAKGLKYRKNGTDAYFTRDALDKRLHPEKRKPAAARR